MFMKVFEDNYHSKFLFVLIHYHIKTISSWQICQKYNQDNIKHPFKTANLNTSCSKSSNCSITLHEMIPGLLFLSSQNTQHDLQNAPKDKTSNYAALRLPWLFTCRPCDNVRMLSLPPPFHEILLFNVSLSPSPLWSFSWLGSQHPKNFVLSQHWFLVATVLFISHPLGYELLKSRRCHIYLWIPGTGHWVANKQINVWKNK